MHGACRQDLVQPRELSALVGGDHGVVEVTGHLVANLAHGRVHLNAALPLEGLGVSLAGEDVTHQQGVTVLVVVLTAGVLGKIHEIRLEPAAGRLGRRVPQRSRRRS